MTWRVRRLGARLPVVQAGAPGRAKGGAADALPAGRASHDVLGEGLRCGTTRPPRRGEFIGVICDTHEGVFLLTDRKLGKLMKDLDKLLQSEWFSRREAAVVRGKLVN